MIAVAEANTNRVASPATVGEICISSRSVAVGYWGREDESRAVFRTRIAGAPGRRFLRTGDLGFYYDRLLFVVGRKDDLIIFNGVNYYPDDLEAASVSAHPAFIGLRAAAFAIETRRRHPTDRYAGTAAAEGRRR